MQLLQEIIKGELESKGLTHDENAPDLLVGFHIILEEKECMANHRSKVHGTPGEQIDENKMIKGVRKALKKYPSKMEGVSPK